MKTLIHDQDGSVAGWTFATFGIPPHKYEACFGIVENSQIIGSVMWEAYRGHDIEVSYFGPNTMTRGLMKACARLCAAGDGLLSCIAGDYANITQQQDYDARHQEDWF